MATSVSSTALSPSPELIVGPILIGCCLNLFTLGILATQYVCYLANDFADGRGTRSLLLWVGLACVTQTCFGFQNAWYFLVSSWSKADMIYDTGPKETPYGLRLQFALTVLIALPVQAFYIHRIARLARSLLGPSLVALWALTAFATGFAASLLELVGDPSQAPILPSQKKTAFDPLGWTYAGASCICDVSIAATMLYQTNLHRSSFRGSNVLSCLQRLTLESGFALALVAISFIISVSVARESNIGLCFSYFFGNVYALSLLAMLNARAHFTWPIGSAARGATAAATAPEENGTSTCPAHTHSAPQTVSRVHTGTSRASALGQDISAGPSRASSRRRVERSIRRDEPAVPRPDSLRLPEAPYQRSIRRLSGEEDERGQSSCFRAFPPSAADEDVGSRGWRQDERPAGLVNNVFASPHFVGGQSLSEIELEEVAPGTTPRGIGDFPSGLVASASGFVEAGEPVDHDAGMRAAMAEGLEEVDFSDHSFSSNGRIPSGLVAGVPSELDSQSWHLHDESSSVDSEDLAPRRATL